jgi:hypothetical protein
MRVELSRFDSQGAVSTSFVELTQELVQEIVQRSEEVTRLRRAGQSLDAALDGLDSAMVSAQVLKPSNEEAPVKTALPATKSLVQAFATLRGSAQPAADGTVVVSQESLDAVGEALQAAVVGDGVSAWKWTKVPAQDQSGQEVQSQDLQAVMEKMSKAAAVGGAPSAKEAMAKYPLLFCQAFAELVRDEQAMRERNANATTIVHFDNGNPNQVVSLSAPAGMTEQDVRAAVQVAVASAGNYNDIPTRLAGAGFEQIEHITVSLPAPPGDDHDMGFDFDDAPR